MICDSQIMNPFASYFACWSNIYTKRFLFQLTIGIKLKYPLILCFSCVLVFRQDTFHQTFALELLAFWLIFSITCTSVGFWKKLMKKLSLQQYIMLFTELRKHLLCFILLESCYHVGTMLCSILMLAISLSNLCFFLEASVGSLWLKCFSDISVISDLSI